MEWFDLFAIRAWALIMRKVYSRYEKVYNSCILVGIRSYWQCHGQYETLSLTLTQSTKIVSILIIFHDRKITKGTHRVHTFYFGYKIILALKTENHSASTIVYQRKSHQKPLFQKAKFIIFIFLNISGDFTLHLNHMFGILR